MATTGQERTVPENGSAGDVRVRRTVLARPTNPDRHAHTVTIDFRRFVDGLLHLPEPDDTAMEYTGAAVDLLAVAIDAAASFRRAAKGAPPNATWTEQLVHVPNETFTTAYELMEAQGQHHMLDAEPQHPATSPQGAAEQIMVEHVLDPGFFNQLYDLVRYAPPETSEEHGRNLL